MADNNLTDYRMDKHEQKLDVVQALLSTHVDDDNDIQSEISSDIKVIKVQLAYLLEETKKWSAKTNNNSDWIAKAIGGAMLLSFLVMAYKYLV